MKVSVIFVCSTYKFLVILILGLAMVDEANWRGCWVSEKLSELLSCELAGYWVNGKVVVFEWVTEWRDDWVVFNNRVGY